MIKFLTERIVCPYCSNCLTIARAEGDAQNPQGLNAFTCRTCPYQFILDDSYFERSFMKKKQKDDIMGEEESDLPINEGL
jgi:DNA-directed RNA polymerase III subunit RPC11